MGAGRRYEFAQRYVPTEQIGRLDGYQDYKLRESEECEQSLKKVQELLASKRKALAEEGFSAFEELEGLEVGKCYRMTLKRGTKEEKAKRKQDQVERKLRMARERFGAAQGGNLGENVDRDRWIDLFAKEMKSRQTKQDGENADSEESVPSEFVCSCQYSKVY